MKAILVALGIILCLGIATASMPEDFATNPHVAKAQISGWYPQILIVGWDDSQTGHFEADIGYVLDGRFIGLLNAFGVPTFTADAQGFFFKENVQRAGPGAGQVFPETPILNETRTK